MEDDFFLFVLGDVIKFLSVLIEGNCGICKNIPSKVFNIFERCNEDDKLGGIVRYKFGDKAYLDFIGFE